MSMWTSDNWCVCRWLCFWVCTWLRVWSPGHSSTIWPGRRDRQPHTSGQSSCPFPQSSKIRASSGKLGLKAEMEKFIMSKYQFTTPPPSDSLCAISWYPSSCLLPSPLSFSSHLLIYYLQHFSTSPPPSTACLTRLTLAMLGLDLHLFQSFQHAPQVSDAILKGDFLILARVGILKQFPHVNIWFHFLRFLVPVSQGRRICM